MSKSNEYTVHTSWGLPIKVPKEEFEFYKLIVMLCKEDFIHRADFLSAEARMIGYGYLNNAKQIAA